VRKKSGEVAAPAGGETGRPHSLAEDYSNAARGNGIFQSSASISYRGGKSKRKFGNFGKSAKKDSKYLFEGGDCRDKKDITGL